MRATTRFGASVFDTDNDGFDELLISAAFDVYDAAIVGRLAAVVLAAPAASIDFQNIPASSRQLLLIAYLRGDNATVTVIPYLRLNGDAGANYDLQQLSGSAAVLQAGENLAVSQLALGAVPAANAPANLFGTVEVKAPRYAGANNKAGTADVASKSGAASGNMTRYAHAWFWRSNAAINRMTLLPAAGNWVAGSEATLYVLP